MMEIYQKSDIKEDSCIENELTNALIIGLNRFLTDQEKQYVKTISNFDNNTSQVVIDWINELSSSHRKGNLGRERVGIKGKNNYGSIMEIVDYKDSNNVWVKFSNGNNLIHTSWNSFCNGKVKNPLDRTVFKIGFHGEGEYIASKGKVSTPQYLTWTSMMRRAYSDQFHTKSPSYKEVTVCEEWHNFQNFAKWYDENYYEVEGERMELDKDILVKGNKIYSPKKCIFVPQRINILFVNNKNQRGNLPVGVNLNKGKFYARGSTINSLNGYELLGSFDKPEEAFVSYKLFKEKYIKEMAEQYKSKIPYKLYSAMINYTINVDD